MKSKISLLTILCLVLLQNSLFALKGYCSQPAEADGKVEVVEVEEVHEGGKAEEGKEVKENKETEENKEAEEGKEAEGK